MHELVETLKWLGIALGWVGAIWMSWALVRVGSAPKEYDEHGLVPIPEPQPVRVQRPPLAKVIPIRQA